MMLFFTSQGYFLMLTSIRKSGRYEYQNEVIKLLGAETISAEMSDTPGFNLQRILKVSRSKFSECVQFSIKLNQFTNSQSHTWTNL